MNSSSLYDEKTFYQTFLQDLDKCQNDVIIESPFVTSDRMRTFDRIFNILIKRGVNIYIITRNPREHNEFMESQSEDAIRWCEVIGIQVLMCAGNHHRKLAMIDRGILWEGSLNILSQTYRQSISQCVIKF